MLREYQPCTLPEVPHPSTLYSLQPLGLGTNTAESLTSFISRLAWEHRVSLSCLLERVIAPITGKRYVINGGARVLSGAFAGYFRAINGTGDTAAEWVGYLEQLTWRSEMSCLTLRHWRHVLSQRELLRWHKAWCPECLAEQLSVLGACYEPLLWSIAAVSVCHVHKRPLRSTCPHCQQGLFHLSRRVRPGYCYRCAGSLQDRARCTVAVSEWELWTATAVSRMVASTHETVEPDNHSLVGGLTTIVERLFEGNMAQFALAIGKQKNTVWGWCNGGSRIRLIDLLSLCYCLYIEPVDFLGPAFRLNFTSPTALRPFVLQTRTRSKSRPLKLALIEKRLREFLEGEGTPSMQGVACSLRINKRLLYKHFPELCRAIAHRRLSRLTAATDEAK